MTTGTMRTDRAMIGRVAEYPKIEHEPAYCVSRNGDAMLRDGAARESKIGGGRGGFGFKAAGAKTVVVVVEADSRSPKIEHKRTGVTTLSSAARG